MALNLEHKFEADLKSFFRTTHLSSKLLMYAKYESSLISCERVIDRKGHITSVELLKTT
jgi:hypothetical protein